MLHTPSPRAAAIPAGVFCGFAYITGGPRTVDTPQLSEARRSSAMEAASKPQRPGADTRAEQTLGSGLHFMAKKGVTAPRKREWKEASFRGGTERSQSEKPSSERSWKEVKAVEGEEGEEGEDTKDGRLQVRRKPVWRRDSDEEHATWTREEAASDPYRALREGTIEERFIDRGGLVGGGSGGGSGSFRDCDEEEGGLRKAWRGFDIPHTDI